MISNSCIILKASIGANIKNYGFLDLVVAYPKKRSNCHVQVDLGAITRIINDLKRSKQTLEGTRTKYHVPIYFSYPFVSEKGWVWN